MSKSKPYHVPHVHQSGIVFKMPTSTFIEEWLAYIQDLASKKSLTPIQRAELADMKPFLEEVIRLRGTTEYASVGPPERSKFASMAQELLDRIDGAVKATTLDDLLKLC